MEFFLNIRVKFMKMAQVLLLFFMWNFHDIKLMGFYPYTSIETTFVKNRSSQFSACADTNVFKKANKWKWSCSFLFLTEKILYLQIIVTVYIFFLAIVKEIR